MSWISTFLTSSLGKKLIMSLTGLFLITFLIVHLAGNLLLLKGDGGEAFNEYAYFMTHNPLIKTISFGLYFFILLHAVLGLIIWVKNREAKGMRYAVSNKNPEVGWASKNMALLGILILAFLFIHMGDFWYKMKFTDQIKLDANGYKDLYHAVFTSFKEGWIVAAYLIGLLALGFHLWHGFQSAFQTLGLNHRKYTPIIKAVGKIFSVAVPAAFAIIPLFYYFVL